ncbi:alpha/beta hydrolase [Nocardioides sp.]|uniref:alpha/beta hydrolase n=1 Tax=Nocardioides sp. TaxID=35761 RepID=UPI001A2EF451|nr:alpha/beta hydrolase [Nocardioides sp.]MBJ7359047.1 alpha/beta fold hydrolase [Nocardioides sp.]
MKDSTTRAVAILIVIALLLAGAGLAISALSDDSTDGTDPGSAPTTPAGPTVEPTPDPGSSDPPAPDLAPFYSQQLDWEECRDGFECSRLTVPVDYAAPGGATIQLEVLRDSADDPSSRVGSLVVNPGGPGAPGTSYAEQASQVFRSALTDSFDVVGFDPRGTGASAPVDCLSDEGMDEFLRADPVPDDAEEIGDVVEGLDEFWAGCVANTDGGADGIVAHVTTVEAARDMDVLRAALGEDTLSYFGASYGTKLGATYADLFPDKVGRLVLDGAVDVSLDSVSLSLGQAAGFERALTAYVDNCVEEGDCFLGDSTQEGLDTIAGVLADLDENPIPTLDERELTVGTGFLGVITPLYNRDYWYLLDQGLETALEGDGTTLQLLADAYASRNRDGSYADNSTEAIYAINCLDDPFAVTPDEVPDYVPQFLEASPTLGEVFAWGLIGCDGIRVESSEPDREIKAAGAAPIVVVGTTRDPATPYEWAVALADQLESGVLVSRDGDGHTGYNSGNDCVDAALEDYLVDGTVPEDGLEC